MANSPYHAITIGGNKEYINLNAPGAPSYWKVIHNLDDGNWYPSFTWNGGDWFNFVPASPFTTQAQAQTALDAFITNLNAGTVGP